MNGGGEEIRITGEPSRTGDRCVFTVDRPVFPSEAAHFTAGNAALSPLAAEILAIPGIESTLIADNTVTVNAAHEVDWPALQIGQIIRRHLRSGTPAVSEAYFAEIPSEGDLKWAIRDLLDREINPAVASHGGWVELIDVKRNSVFLRLGGGCQGCGAADVTLKQGIEKAIRSLAPAVGEILDTTDHAAGRNPYYAPAK
ncbi:MAG TPA: NifU family protein [Thermoanaerobaculia bacterium]|jgi:Fe-S cluster biogenesis protein NfuA